MCDHCQSDDLDLHSRSLVHLKLDYFLTSNISDNIFSVISYYMKTWHNSRLMDALYIYTPACFNDLNIDALSQWVGKGKNQCCMLSATKQAISMKFATTVGHFYVTLQTFYMA